MSQNPQKVTHTQNYRIVSKSSAFKIGQMFELDSTNHNYYFILENKLRYDEPRLIRDFISYIKNDIPDKMIYVLDLQKTDIKVHYEKEKPKVVQVFSAMNNHEDIEINEEDMEVEPD